MSKELEALKYLKNRTICKTEKISYPYDNLVKALVDIETAVKDYENLKVISTKLTDKDLDDLKVIAKKLKAFEIIKEKLVIPVFIYNAENVEDYNRQLRLITFKKDYEQRKLTEQEFDLLKEVLL